MDREEDQTPNEAQSTPESRGDAAPGAPEQSMSSPINWDEDEERTASASHDERPDGLDGSRRSSSPHPSDLAAASI